ncbi:MAG: hypothetical protein PHE06_12685 [Lachnospiraceae bacterium]|nr:hypothetical protein [Lachnospiraceae bacterium]
MNIIGKNVKHVKYGMGKIASVDDNKMKVDFPASVKIFAYPDAFETYFSIEDPQARKYVYLLLEERNHMKREKKVQKEKESQRRLYAEKMKIKVNSHGVFAMRENSLKEVLDTGEIFTGCYASGKDKGNPRLPKNLNMNSACLLTIKPEEGKEKDRVIAGVFMTEEDFIGEECEDGKIRLHEKYGITWGADQDELLFWKYFPQESRLVRWQSAEMKYIPSAIVQRVLEDMRKLASEDETRQEIKEFQEYFCQMNHL